MRIFKILDAFQKSSLSFSYQYKDSTSTLSLFFADQSLHNALSESILLFLKSLFDQVEGEDILCLEIHFVASDKKISCSGLHLKEFAGHCATKKPGEDVLSEDHLFVQVMKTLRSVSQSIKIICCVDGHLIGAGMEFALSCTKIKVLNPRSLMMLPYLRIGLPYYREGLHHIVHKIGFELVSRMILCEQQTFFTAEIVQESELLNTEKKQEQALQAVKRFEDFFRSGGVFSCAHSCRLLDKTGGLKAILSYHYLLALKIVSSLDGQLFHQMVEDYRLQAHTQEFLVEIQKHARQPSKANSAFQKQIQLKK